MKTAVFNCDRCEKILVLTIRLFCNKTKCMIFLFPNKIDVIKITFGYEYFVINLLLLNYSVFL